MTQAGMGKTHLVQDKSLGPGLHSQHYRLVREAESRHTYVYVYICMFVYVYIRFLCGII